MLKIVLPVVLALGGLGAGIGAGIALKPEAVASAEPCAEPEAEPEAEGAAGQGSAVEDTGCAESAGGHAAPAALETVSLDKPFVVPIFADEKVVAMVVLSLSLEVAQGRGGLVATLQPRLRDGLLATMFRHANSGGFEGAFTHGQKMADLKAGLLAAAREVIPEAGVGEVLVTEIVRQDV